MWASPPTEESESEKHPAMCLSTLQGVAILFFYLLVIRLSSSFYSSKIFATVYQFKVFHRRYTEPFNSSILFKHIEHWCGCQNSIFIRAENKCPSILYFSRSTMFKVREFLRLYFFRNRQCLFKSNHNSHLQVNNRYNLSISGRTLSENNLPSTLNESSNSPML